MNEFIAKYQPQITGVLSGFDRLLLRGNLRALCGLPGMEQYLATERVRYVEFGAHVQRVSERLKQASLARAQREGRPVQYLTSSSISKEELARGIAQQDKIERGLVCVLTCVEPCMTYEIYRCRQKRQLELVQRQRKCLHIYQYWMHPHLGFLNARIQTWFPFRIQVCLNGREWLARQMDRQRLKYLRQDNCFAWVEDFQRAQQLLDRQLKTDWPKMLKRLARELNPEHDRMFERFRIDYYWTVPQSEWAIDVVFANESVLQRLFPKFVLHAITTLGSVDVLRFLGRRVPLAGTVPRSFQGQILSDLKQRREGLRVKHGVNGNTVKVYDKAFTAVGSVLRFETTLHNGDDFRVWRPKEGDPKGIPNWRPMRRGIADLYRRAQVSHRAAERYMNALATVDDDTTMHELTRELEQPVFYKGKRVRGLRLFDPADQHLLQAVSRGEFTINGLRNRDLRSIFFPGTASSTKEARRRSAWISRRLRLLLAHALIQKVPHTHRYHVTKCGRTIITAILAAGRATIAQLLKTAA